MESSNVPCGGSVVSTNTENSLPVQRKTLSSTFREATAVKYKSPTVVSSSNFNVA